MAEVALRDITRNVGGRPIVSDVTLTIRDREFVVFVGPSGCGKTTLLRLIAGLDDISAGELSIDGVRANALRPKERGVAMVFQSYALYPHMTVFDNMAFGLQGGKLSRTEVAARVRQAAEALQLTPLLERLPKELSGGQRQRVAIGRAIVREPKLFLFDEPLSNLDAALRVQMRLEISRLHQELGATIVYVTHDQLEAMTLADRIVVLRGGRVEQIGAPLDLYHRPANRFVAGFIGSPQMNFVEATVEAIGADCVVLRLADATMLEIPLDAAGLRIGAKVTLGIRPEHLHADAALQAVSAQVRATCLRVEQLGDSHLLHAELSTGERLTLRGSGSSVHAAGDELMLALDPKQCHVFDESGGALCRPAQPSAPRALG